jgi:hypothetical protein
LRPIPEADWKTLRQLHPIALDRFCRRVLSEIERLAADSEMTPHQRYQAIFGCIKERDRELADAFDDPRRSTALLQLARLRSLGLLTEEELSGFGSETREFLQVMNPDRQD